MMKHRNLRSFLLFALLLAWLPFSVRADFTKIADASTAIPSGTGNFADSQFGTPVVYGSNVAFYGANSGQTQKGIYLWSGGTLSRAADLATSVPNGSGSFTNFSFYDYSVNSSGDALFRAQGASRVGVYRSSKGTLSRVVDTTFDATGGTGKLTNMYTLSEYGGTSVFGGQDQGANLPYGIYSYNGTTLTMLVNSNTALPGTSAKLNVTDYVINDNNTLAFWAYRTDSRSAIYSYSAGTLYMIVDTNTLVPGSSAKFTSFLSPPNINGSTVTFVGNSSGGWGIYSANVDGTGLVRQVDSTMNTPDNSGHFTTFFGGFAYHNGTLYFSANYSGTSGAGVFAVTSGTVTNVLVPGATLDGKTVKSANFDGTSALRGGAMALKVSFTDSTVALYHTMIDSGSSGPSLSSPLLVNGGFQMTLSLTAGQSYRLQGSTDLSSSANWMTLTNIVNAPASLQYVDADAANMSYRFYRIVSP